MPDETKTPGLVEPVKDTLAEKELGVRFKFKIGQVVKTKGFGVKYVVQNRYHIKGHPFYDLFNYDAAQDWRNYQQVIEEVLEPVVASKSGKGGGGGV